MTGQTEQEECFTNTKLNARTERLRMLAAILIPRSMMNGGAASMHT